MDNFLGDTSLQNIKKKYKIMNSLYAIFLMKLSIVIATP